MLAHACVSRRAAGFSPLAQCETARTDQKSRHNICATHTAASAPVNTSIVVMRSQKAKPRRLRITLQQAARDRQPWPAAIRAQLDCAKHGNCRVSAKEKNRLPLHTSPAAMEIPDRCQMIPGGRRQRAQRLHHLPRNQQAWPGQENGRSWPAKIQLPRRKIAKSRQSAPNLQSATRLPRVARHAE